MERNICAWPTVLNWKIILIILSPLFLYSVYVNQTSDSWPSIFPENLLSETNSRQEIVEDMLRMPGNLLMDTKVEKKLLDGETNELKQSRRELPPPHAAKFVDPPPMAVDHDMSDFENHRAPIRGPGDSYLPFQKDYTPILGKLPEDLFKEKPKDSYHLAEGSSSLKKILFWNDIFGAESFYLGYGQEPFLLAKCPVNTCFTTSDRSRFPLEELDAIIWHPRSVDLALPDKRSPHTRYVFWSHESPPNIGINLSEYEGIFNWTFTYRLDSDIHNPYDVVYRRRSPLAVAKDKNYATGKKYLAAWFVSNCHTQSGRETFVSTLQKWIQIDIYGKCGLLKCSRDHELDCYEMVERDYKFYLSFENSLCKDYVTEKIFNILKINVVPVVYGLGNYSSLLPPHSYINALDFPSAKALADYLLYLDKNDTAYNEYFQWKPYHHFTLQWLRIAKPWCEFCERLHNDHSEKVYDLEEWFNVDSHCMDNNTPRISRLVNGYIDRTSV